MDEPAAQQPDVVATYWRLKELRAGDRASRLASEEFWWAWEVVHDAMVEGGEAALALLDDLLNWPTAEPCDVGAGPLEDLLGDFPDLAEAVATRCRLNPLWRAAAECVWSSDARVLSALKLYVPQPPG